MNEAETVQNGIPIPTTTDGSSRHDISSYRVPVVEYAVQWGRSVRRTLLAVTGIVLVSAALVACSGKRDGGPNVWIETIAPATSTAFVEPTQPVVEPTQIPIVTRTSPTAIVPTATKISQPDTTVTRPDLATATTVPVETPQVGDGNFGGVQMADVQIVTQEEATHDEDIVSTAGTISYREIMRLAGEDRRLVELLRKKVTYIPGISVVPKEEFSYQQIVKAFGALSDPLPGGIFNDSNPFGKMRSYGPHGGIDVGHDDDNAVIRALAGGEVVLAGPWYMLGENAIFVESGKIGEYSVVIVYGHQKDSRVSTGDLTQSGDELGGMGDDGNATYPHVHIGMYLIRTGADGDVRNQFFWDETSQSYMWLWVNDKHERVVFPIDPTPVYQIIVRAMEAKNPVPVVEQSSGQDVQLVEANAKVLHDSALSQYDIITTVEGTIPGGGLIVVASQDPSIPKPELILDKAYPDGWQTFYVLVPDGTTAVGVDTHMGNGTCWMQVGSGDVSSNCGINNMFGLYPNGQQSVTLKLRHATLGRTEHKFSLN